MHIISSTFLLHSNDSPNVHCSCSSHNFTSSRYILYARANALKQRTVHSLVTTTATTTTTPLTPPFTLQRRQPLFSPFQRRALILQRTSQLNQTVCLFHNISFSPCHGKISTRQCVWCVDDHCASCHRLDINLLHGRSVRTDGVQVRASLLIQPCPIKQWL